MKSRAGAGLAAALTAGLFAVAPAASASSARITVNTALDTVDANTSDGRCADSAGRCSLRAAVQTANVASGPVEIVLTNATYALTLTGTGGAESGDLDVIGSVTVSGRNGIVELAGLGDRAFDVPAGSSLAVRQLTVRNGALPAGESGGAFRSAGTLRLDSVTATGNVVSGTGASGGAVLNQNGTLTVFRSLMASNSATRAGGAIEADRGTTVLDRVTLDDNSTGASPGNGGGLHLTGAGRVEIERSIVTDNVASREGGGLWNSATGTVIIEDTTITGNSGDGPAADDGGGGLFNDGGTMKVVDSTIADNHAPGAAGSGGGIFNNVGLLSVEDSVIQGNSAIRAGGGVETLRGSVTISDTEIDGNSTGASPGNGGGVHVTESGADVTIVDSEVTDNTAALEGGGLWAGPKGSVMRVIDTVVSGNVANGTGAAQGGGGLFNKGGLLVVEDSTISDNQAIQGSASGGGILNLGKLEVVDTTIDGNRAARAGGGIESTNNADGQSFADSTNAGDSVLVDVRLTDNVTGAAPGNGGGVHVTQESGKRQVTTLISDSVVTGNTAANEGGGLWNASGAVMTVTGTVITGNDAPLGPNVFQKGVTGGFTVDGSLIPAGDNDLAFP